jgi:DHA2 family multidrug resistance protein
MPEEAPIESSSANNPNRLLLTILIMSATMMQTIDGTIANVALPKMQGSLSVTQDEIAWVLTSYIVASAIMIPLTGWLAGRFGRKITFLISIGGFTLTSALCGIATSLPEIVLFRLLQGIAGAALVPLAQALLLDINPPENHGKAMAMWGVGVTMGPILGPVLGGWLTETYNWRWVFYINVPIGIAAFFGLLALMPDTKKNISRFDFFGFFTLSIAIGALQLMLDRGERQDWFNSNEIRIYAIICIITFYQFLIHTLSYAKPFLSTELFINRNFVTANVFIFIIGVVLFATLALLPPMLQNQMGYPVITTGLVTAPRGAGSMLGMLIVGRIIGKIDIRLIITSGLCLTAISLWQMTQFNLLMAENSVIFSGFIQGLGIGLCFVPLSIVAFGNLPTHLRNEGTAFFNLVRNVGSSMGISVVEAVLAHKVQIMHSTLVEHLTPYNTKIRSQTELLQINEMITNQATMIAYTNDFKLMMVMTLAVIPLVLLLRAPKVKKDKTEEMAVID